MIESITYNDLPLLEDASLNDLPAPLKTLLDSHREHPPYLNFTPWFIPPAPLFDNVGLILSGGGAVIICGVMIFQAISGELTLFSGVLLLGLILCILGLSKWFFDRRAEALRLRAPYLEGRWRAGLYVLDHALLEFDGRHVWLFPRKSILEVIFDQVSSSGPPQHQLRYQRTDGGEEVHPLIGDHLVVHDLQIWHKNVDVYD